MITKFKFTAVAITVAATLNISGCGQPQESTDEQRVQTTYTLEDVNKFIDETASELVQLNHKGSQIEWVYQNFINDDTAALSAEAGQKFTEAGVRFALQAAKYDHVVMPAEQVKDVMDYVKFLIKEKQKEAVEDIKKA